jgi:hypothetical protein
MMFRFAQQTGLRSDNPAERIAQQFPMYKQPDARRMSPSADQNLSADLRRVIEQHYGAMPVQLKKEIDRALAPLVQQLADMREDVGHVRKHQIDIAREVGAVEKPTAPRSSRRQPLGD